MFQQQLDVLLGKVAAQSPGGPFAVSDQLATIRPRTVGISGCAFDANWPRDHHMPNADASQRALGVETARSHLVLGDRNLEPVHHARDSRSPTRGAFPL